MENGIVPKDKRKLHEKTRKKKKPPDRHTIKRKKDENENKRWLSVIEITKKEVARWIVEGQRSNWWKMDI